jgi:hypothetical protein
MAKIIEAVRPNAAQRIATVQRVIDDAEKELGELRTAQAAKLLDEDAAESIKIADKIEFAERRLGVFRERLAALQKLTRQEKIDQRARQKAEALTAFEKNFADARVAAATRIIRATIELSAALRDHAQACREPFASYPHHLFPPIKTFEGSSYSYVPSVIASALRMQNPGAAQTLLVKLPARISDLAERDVKLCASLLEDIRNAPLPKLPEPSEIEGEAA